MSLAIRCMAEPVRELAFGALGVAYMPVGTQMTRPIRILVFQNTTDTAVMISFDGVDDHLPLVPNGYMILDLTSNKTIPQGFFFAEGQTVFAKQIGAIPTSGSVYVSAFYGAEL
jgi:hypothetical protein